jgi:hypothetical protein
MNERLLMPKSRFITFLEKELKELLPPTVFFAVSFNLIVSRIILPGTGLPLSRSGSSFCS